jgi:hypothetical protein
MSMRNSSPPRTGEMSPQATEGVPFPRPRRASRSRRPPFPRLHRGHHDVPFPRAVTTSCRGRRPRRPVALQQPRNIPTPGRTGSSVPTKERVACGRENPTTAAAVPLPLAREAWGWTRQKSRPDVRPSGSPYAIYRCSPVTVTRNTRGYLCGLSTSRA